jgi:flagellar motor protein MotB
MRSRNPSLLHLQLGQEVIYLLLTTFGLLSLILAVVLANKSLELAELDNRVQSLLSRIGQLSTENTRLRTTASTVVLKDQQVAGLSDRLAQLDRMVEALASEVRRLTAENQRLRQYAERRDREIAALSSDMNNKPPIINLKETEGFTFPVGEATLTAAFQEKLTREAVPAFVEAARRYKATVIEVIGHTDELPIGNRSSNLDLLLIAYLNSARGVAGVSPQLTVADNTGLGMARAAAVANFLLRDPQLRSFQILPMSGAQVINSDGTLSTGGGNTRDSAARRRIELRARRPN